MDRPSPDAYQPPLTRWQHAWRLVLAAGFSALAWGAVAQAQWQTRRDLFWVDLAIGIASFVVVGWRRRRPFGVAVALSTVGVFSALASGPAILAAVSLATRRRLPQILVVGVLGVLGGWLFAEVQPEQDASPWWVTAGFNLVFVAAVLLWGMYLGSRRELVWTLRQRALVAEAEQELRADRARANERERLAREMHDVLAHRISQISLHAGALAFRRDLDADDLRAGAGRIQSTANQALDDLRGVLGVLRDPETGDPLDQPQPTYADLPRLVEEVRGTGLHVEYDDRLSRDAVPDAVGRTLYRIAQEGITNARKHAPGSLVRIEVGGDPERGVDIWVRNPLGFGPSQAPGAGLGLIGLSERAELRGGRLEHRREGRTFVLHGWIPWAA